MAAGTTKVWVFTIVLNEPCKWLAEIIAEEGFEALLSTSDSLLYVKGPDGIKGTISLSREDVEQLMEHKQTRVVLPDGQEAIWNLSIE
jgi:hypothetical protein